jgi:hypothetical protein
VLEQIKAAQDKINSKKEVFGKTWFEYAGNVALARSQIRAHVERIRDDWANKWEFFGKVPRPIHREGLAQTIERSLWAGHILERFSDERRYGEPDIETSVEGFGEAVGGKVLENVIVVQLKNLNVIQAETTKGAYEQQARIGNPDLQSPVPGTRIKDEVDTRTEVQRLKEWANKYLETVRGDSQIRYFPPATVRRLEPLA